MFKNGEKFKQVSRYLFKLKLLEIVQYGVFMCDVLKFVLSFYRLPKSTDVLTMYTNEARPAAKKRQCQNVKNIS